MALSSNTLSLKLPWKPPPHPHHQSPTKLQSPSFPLKFKPISIYSNSSFISRLPQSRNGVFVRRAVEESQEQTESEQLTESKAKPEVRPSETPREQGGEKEISDLGAEIRKAMMEKKKEEKAGGGGGDLFNGVAEEVREIEWPSFGRVLGTTGVVLGVIAGSSVVLLTVNALLAELSDKVFVGRGVQDFFS
ncbi:Preprotein translocase subunit SECE1 [Linum perenne]